MTPIRLLALPLLLTAALGVTACGQSDEDKAKAILDTARSRFGKVLSKAAPFTEKVTVDGSTLYRARFSGFSESNDAANACKQLKKGGVNCFASRG